MSLTTEIRHQKNNQPHGKHHKPGKPPKQPTPAGRWAVATHFEVETTVKWYNSNRGYGFLENPDGDKDIFFHHRLLQQGAKAPVQGQRARIDYGKGHKGPEATNIKLL